MPCFQNFSERIEGFDCRFRVSVDVFLCSRFLLSTMSFWKRPTRYRLRCFYHAWPSMKPFCGTSRFGYISYFHVSFSQFFFLKLFLINLCEEISMYGFFKTKNINIYFYGLYKNTFFLLVCAFKGIWIYIWKHMQETYIFHCDAVFNKHFLLVIRTSFWK